MAIYVHEIGFLKALQRFLFEILAYAEQKQKVTTAREQEVSST